MKKLSAFLFMLLLIISFNACDDDSSSGGGGGHAWDLQFEVPTDYAATVTEDEIYIYSLHKDPEGWHMDTVDADTSTPAADPKDYTNLTGVDPFDAYPFDITLGDGNYLEIVKTGTDDTDGITSIDEYDQIDELTTDQIYQTFGYRLVGTDNFTSPDMIWDIFQTGYLYESLAPLDNPRTWFPDFGDPTAMAELPSGTDGGSWNGKYMMKKFAFVQLYRMIQIVDGSTTNNVLIADYTGQSITITYWNNNQTTQKTNKAVPMTDILTTDDYGDLTGKYFIVTPADYDTYGANSDTHDPEEEYNVYEWEDMQNAYVVTNIEVDSKSGLDNPCSKGKILFIDPSLIPASDPRIIDPIAHPDGLTNTMLHQAVKYVTKIEIVDAIP